MQPVGKGNPEVADVVARTVLVGTVVVRAVVVAGVVVGAVVGAGSPSKQRQALLIPGVGTSNMKLGTTVETPGARAKKPGQNWSDSTEKNLKVSST